MASQVVSVEKRFRMSLLLDLYGELLTDKQRDFMKRYYEQDNSFGEIARDFDVSRQAIFDSVKHGEASLENYERVLKLAATGRRGAGGDVASSPETPRRLAEAASRLRALADEMESDDFTGDPKAVAKRIDALAAEIEELTDEAAAPAMAGGASGDGAPRASIFSKGGGLEVD